MCAKPGEIYANEELALVDELTGIYNRRAFNKYLKELTSESMEKGFNLLLIVMDVDHFKEVNDTYGHLTGDNLIQGVASLLKQNVRDMDVVCRYGGDEFVILFPRANKDIVHEIAERIRKSIEEYAFKSADGSCEIRVTVSIGYASLPDEAADSEELFSQSDKALYASKELGRNVVSGISEVSARIEKINAVKKNIYKPPLVVNLKEIERAESMFFGEGKRRRVVLIKGGRGVGKTRFMDEIRNKSKEEQILDIALSPNKIEQKQPYKFISQALIEFSKSNEIIYLEALDRISADSKKSMGEFLPELILQKSDIHVKHQHVEKAKIFMAFSELLLEVAHGRGIMFFIDNIHWMDEATLDLLKYLIASEETHVNICGTYCVEDVDEGDLTSTLLRWMSDVSEVEIIPEILLKPLDQVGTDTFLKAVLNEPKIDAEFSGIIHRLTQGNLLFMVELISYLVEEEIIYLREEKWNFAKVDEAQLPHSLKALIQKRFEELTPEIKDILTVAASMGQDFSFNILSKLMKTNEGYLFDIMDKARNAHIMQTVMEVAGEKVQFVSDGVRQTVYNGLDSGVKKNIHAQIGRLVEEQYKGKEENVSAALAYHFEMADSKQKAVEYAKMVAKRAEEIFSDQEAMKLFEQAVKEREMKEKSEPISQDLVPLVNNLIKSILVSIWNIRIYPADNKMVKSSKDEVYENLVRLLKVRDSIMLSAPKDEKQQNLLVNGATIKATETEKMFYATFLTTLKNSNLYSISIKKGVTKDEVMNFLDVFGDPDAYLTKAEEWKTILAEYHIKHISVDEIVYRRVYTDDEKKERRKELLESLAVTGSLMDVAPEGPGRAPASAGGDITKQDIDNILALIDKVMQKFDREDMALLKGSLQNLALALEKGASIGGEKKRRLISALNPDEIDVFSETLSYMPDEMVVTTIVDLYKKTRGSIEGIKVLVDRLFSDPERRKKLATTLYNKLKENGMAHECIVWLIEPMPWLSMPLPKRTQLLLSTTAYAIIEIGLKTNIEPTLLELLQSNETEVAVTVLTKLIDNLSLDNYKLRIDVVETAMNIFRLVKEQKILLQSSAFTARLLEFFDKENDLTVYSLIAECLENMAQIFIELEQYNQAKSIAMKLKEHAARDDAEFAEYIQRAKDSLFGIGGENIIAGLVNKIVDASSEDQDAILEIVKCIGQKSIPLFVKFLVDTEEETLPFNIYVVHKKVLDTLSGMGDEYIWELVGKLSDEKWIIAKNAITLLGNLKRDDIVPYLNIPARHNDYRVRRAVVLALKQIATPSAAAAMAEFIRDPESDIKSLAVEGLCQIADSSILGVLEDMEHVRKYRKDVQKIIREIKRKEKR